MTPSHATRRSHPPELRARPEPRQRTPTGAPAGLATKGDEVEEWLDLRFFRPIGLRIARGLAGTRATADQVTLLSLITGLAAGHLFFYTSPWLNAAGFVLFIISDIFDSADGQLARIRGTSTRFGRALDGASDAARFINLGAHLLARLVVAQQWSWYAATGLVVAAAVSQSAQSGSIDFIRHAFLALGAGRGSELDVDGTIEAPPGSSWLRRVAASIYRGYSRRQGRLFPCTAKLLRAEQRLQWGPAAAGAYRSEIRPLLGSCAWLGQNLRFIILGITAVAGWPAGLLWVTLIPMNLVLLWLRHAQEAGARRVARVVPAFGIPSPTPVRAACGE